MMTRLRAHKWSMKVVDAASLMCDGITEPDTGPALSAVYTQTPFLLQWTHIGDQGTVHIIISDHWVFIELDPSWPSLYLPVECWGHDVRADLRTVPPVRVGDQSEASSCWCGPIRGRESATPGAGTQAGAPHTRAHTKFSWFGSLVPALAHVTTALWETRVTDHVQAYFDALKRQFWLFHGFLRPLRAFLMSF